MNQVPHTEKFLSRTASIEDICIDVHNCAVAHGWWESGDRSIEEQRLLFASEVLEAFERYRKAPPETMHVEVAEELVDVLIRLYDAYVQGRGSSDTLAFDEATDEFIPEMERLPASPSLVAIATWCTGLVSKIDADDLTKSRSDAEIISLLDDILVGISRMEATSGDTREAGWFRDTVANGTLSVALFCAIHGIDFPTILLNKMRANWDRPYRHGGRRA